MPSYAGQTADHRLDASSFLVQPQAPQGQTVPTECSICFEGENEEKGNLQALNQCKNGHSFHGPCIQHWFNKKTTCPTCKHNYGVQIGNQPQNGFMTLRKLSNSLKGHEGKGTLEIQFYFPAGVQGPEHDAPGVAYPKDRRRAYLPETEEGLEILAMLKQAWDQRLLFTVGHSLTRQKDNQIIFNGIHLKTSMFRGEHGWPDPNYFRNVKDELATKGILPENRSPSELLRHIQSHFPNYQGEFSIHPQPGEEADPSIGALNWEVLSKPVINHYERAATPTLSPIGIAHLVQKTLEQKSLGHAQTLNTRAHSSEWTLSQWVVAKTLAPPSTDSTDHEEEIRNMLIFILQGLNGFPNEADEVASILQGLQKAKSARCIQDQLELTGKIYRKLKGPTLAEEMAGLINELKSEWLLDSMEQAEAGSTQDLNKVKAYRDALDPYFNIPEIRGTSFNPSKVQKASSEIGLYEVKRNFQATAKAEDVIAAGLSYFKRVNHGPQTREDTIQFLTQNGFLAAVRKNLAQSLVQRQEKLLLGPVFQSTGFSSWDEYENTLNQTPELAAKKAQLHESNVSLVVFTDRKYRNQIIQSGLKNIYETGESSQKNSALRRTVFERSQINFSEDEYFQLPESARAHFGAVLGKTPTLSNLFLGTYGDDYFVLDLEAIQDRLTVAPTNSVKRFAYKLNDDNYDEDGNIIFPFNKWNDGYIPWRLRDLLVPYLLEKDENSPILPKVASIPPHSSVSRMGPLDGDRKGGGIEFQVWGTIPSQFIKNFVFTRFVPSPKDLRDLADKNIETMDGRGFPSVPYKTRFFQLDSKKKCSFYEFNVSSIRLVEEGVDMKNCVPTPASQIIASFTNQKSGIFTEEFLARFFSLTPKPTLLEVLQLADLSSDPNQVRKYAGSRGYQSSPQSLLDLWAGRGNLNWNKENLAVFYSLDSKPTVGEVASMMRNASSKYYPEIRKYNYKVASSLSSYWSAFRSETWMSLNNIYLSPPKTADSDARVRISLKRAMKDCKAQQARVPTPEEFEELYFVYGSYMPDPKFRYLTSDPEKIFNGETGKIEPVDPSLPVTYRCMK